MLVPENRKVNKRLLLPFQKKKISKGEIHEKNNLIITGGIDHLEPSTSFLSLVPLISAQTGDGSEGSRCTVGQNPSIRASCTAQPCSGGYKWSNGRCMNGRATCTGRVTCQEGNSLPEFSSIGFGLAALGGLGGYTFYRKKKA
jgi:hypothetical protein